MSLSKAKIFVERVKKDGTTSKDKKETVQVLFNPNQYSINSQNNYEFVTPHGSPTPFAYFVGGEQDTLSLELFFDTYAIKKDVRKHTEKITNLLKVDDELGLPPICTFVWGKVRFKGVIEKVDQTFTMFLSSGTPVRATLNVEFTATEELIGEVHKQALDRTKERTVKEGEELWMIANDEYGDPGMWRYIAHENLIDDPKNIETGTILVIPRLD